MNLTDFNCHNMTVYTTGPKNVTSLLMVADANICSNTTLSARFQQNSAVLFLSLAEIILHFLDLAVFHLWRHKEPFVLFHVSLAGTSALLAMLQIVFPLSHLAAAIHWTSHTRALMALIMALFTFVRRTSMVNTLFISMDRWLSVEFPLRYRMFVTRRGVIVAIPFIWLISAVITVPGIVILRNGIDVSCSRPHTFYMTDQNNSPGRKIVAGLANGPFLIPLLFIFQLRILMIAVTAKLKNFRHQRQISPLSSDNNQEVKPKNAATVAQPIVCIVWGNLLASMAIVISTVAASFPYLITAYLNTPRTVQLLHVENTLLAVQPLCPPLIYLLFFPQFRAAARRLVRILLCRGPRRVRFLNQPPQGR